MNQDQARTQMRESLGRLLRRVKVNAIGVVTNPPPNPPTLEWADATCVGDDVRTLGVPAIRRTDGQ